MTAQEAYENACRESSLAYETLHAALPDRLKELLQREATAWFSYQKQTTATQDLLYGIVAPEGQVPFDLDQYLACLTLLQPRGRQC